MPQHTCQRVPNPEPNLLTTHGEGKPETCGKIAHFIYEGFDGYKAWLCAECYDFVMMVFLRPN